MAGPGYVGQLDWTGIPEGAPQSTPAAGYAGTLDWTGIPEGVPNLGGGYLGIVDWTGISCGALAVPVTTPSEGTGGKRVQRVPRRRSKPKVNEDLELLVLLEAFSDGW
jgi:hypothetical protein